MIGRDLFEVDGPNSFTDGDNHEAQGGGQRTAHGAASTLAEAFFGQERMFAYSMLT